MYMFEELGNNNNNVGNDDHSCIEGVGTIFNYVNVCQGKFYYNFYILLV